MHVAEPQAATTEYKSGKLVKVERFMLENTKSLVVNFDEPDALLASRPA